MTKSRTSKKQEFSLRDMPIHKLKKDVKVKKVNSAKRLKNQDLMFKALWQSLVEEDIDSFKEILRGHLDAVNKEQLIKRSGTSRRTLYRILSSEGNPTLKSISKVIAAIYR